MHYSSISRGINEIEGGASEGKKISNLIGEVIMLDCNDVMTVMGVIRQHECPLYLTKFPILNDAQEGRVIIFPLEEDGLTLSA